MTFTTIEEVKQANKDSGFYFFSKDNMSFFNSRIESGVYGGKYFVTSERFDSSVPRTYTIRVVSDTAEIDTVGKFQEYKTKRQAIKYIEENLT